MAATVTNPVAIKYAGTTAKRIMIINCEYQQHGGESVVVKDEIKLLKMGGNSVSLLEFSNRGKTLWKLFQLPFNISSYLRTLKKIKQFKPDVVHIHNLHFAATAAVIYAAKSLKVPIVMTLHNFRLLCPSAILFFKGQTFLNSLRESFCLSAVKRGVYHDSKLLTFWLAFSMWIHQKFGTMQLVDKYICLSQHAGNFFENSKLQLKKERFSIMPNFVAAPESWPVLRGPHFLFAGRLSKEKGIDMLLDVFSKSGYELKIAGTGPCKEKVLDYCRRFSNIIYLGVLEKKDVYREMQSCSALVFPSAWYEGMPLTIIEAFACKTPVIASNMGAMAHMIKSGFNGLHFEPKNANDFSEKLKEWQSLAAHKREEFYTNSYRTYQRFYTPEKNIKQLLSIYDSVIPQGYKLSIA